MPTTPTNTRSGSAPSPTTPATPAPEIPSVTAAPCPHHAVHGPLTCQDVEGLLADATASLENTRAANTGFQATIEGLLDEVADLHRQIAALRGPKTSPDQAA